MRGLKSAKRVGLVLEQCRHTSEPIRCDCELQAIERLVQDKMSSDGAAVIWQVHRIDWCKLRGGRLESLEKLTPENWLEFRVFNDDEEIHAKRVGDQFVGRYARDELGESTYFADSFSRLWGERVDFSDGWIELKDRQRKLRLKVPCEDGTANWYGLKTRNYIDSDSETGLSGFVDYRFVSIEPAEGGD